MAFKDSLATVLEEGTARIQPAKIGKHAMALLHMREPPWEIIGTITDAIDQGIPPGTAAMMAGMTKRELIYVLALGRERHPAWDEFYDLFIIALGKARAGIDVKLYQKAKEDGDLASMERWYRRVDP